MQRDLDKVRKFEQKDVDRQRDSKRTESDAKFKEEKRKVDQEIKMLASETTNISDQISQYRKQKLETEVS